MNIEDFDNDLSSDDSDFCPEKLQDSVSENSGPEDDDRDGSDTEIGKKKTKKSKKVSKRRRADSEEVEEEKYEPKEIDREEEKRRAEALWADFLGETETPPEPKKPTATSSSSASKPSSSVPRVNIPTKPQVEEKEIFEFAGEIVEIPVKSSEPQKATPEASPSPKFAGVKRSGGGLSAALNQLNKKNKLSVLEKTKIDWDGFKTNEGIGEELQSHNRGRDGYVKIPQSRPLILSH